MIRLTYMTAAWPLLLALLLVAAVGATLALRRPGPSTPLVRRRRWAGAAYWVWLCATAFFVFYRQPGGRHEAVLTLNLSPVNVTANLLLFLPAGLLPVLGRLRWAAWAVPVAAALSVAIETVQYVVPLGRTADVNDVLANTVGAALGVALATYLRRRGILADRAPARSGPAAE